MIQNKPIDVISLCSADGAIQPLRFQINEDGQSAVRINIDQVISMKPVMMVGIESMIFLCRCSIAGVSRLFEIKYTVRSHTWSLVRVVS